MSSQERSDLESVRELLNRSQHLKLEAARLRAESEKLGVKIRKAVDNAKEEQDDQDQQAAGEN